MQNCPSVHDTPSAVNDRNEMDIYFDNEDYDSDVDLMHNPISNPSSVMSSSIRVYACQILEEIRGKVTESTGSDLLTPFKKKREGVFICNCI